MSRNGVRSTRPPLTTRMRPGRSTTKRRAVAARRGEVGGLVEAAQEQQPDGPRGGGRGAALDLGRHGTCRGGGRLRGERVLPSPDVHPGSPRRGRGNGRAERAEALTQQEYGNDS